MTSKFITGKAGVGKTYMAKQLLFEAKSEYETIKSKYHPLVAKEELYKKYSIPELIMEARIPKRALELIKEATFAEVIILDDLGMNKNSNYNPDIVYIILNKRLEKGKTTIVTSNLSITRIGEEIDDRLASRLASFEVVEIEGKDRRIA
jgi:DNA replication protein DnaC